jgi:DNA-binding GntR family transcriptional regulator
MEGPLIRPPTLTTAAAESIRNSIIRGDIQPGEALREVDLSKTLEVSRSTIREALRQLQEENLVEIFPHKGAYVRRLTPTTTRELYTFRALLEPFAVRLAMEAESYSNDDLKKIEQLARKLDELEPIEDVIFEAVEADVSFHRNICETCGHRLILDTLSRLQSIALLFFLNVRHYLSDAYRTGPSHIEISDAIKSGDVNTAEATLRNHINSSGQSLLQRLPNSVWEDLAGESEIELNQG